MPTNISPPSRLASLPKLASTAVSRSLRSSRANCPWFAVHGGGKDVLPLKPLFDGIAAHPTAPEYWWIYTLLLSTMVPSLINLVIGGPSFLRGIPGLPIGDRFGISLALTAQLAGGVLLGIAAQALLVVVIIGHVMPWLGLGLLDMARELSAFNLPGQLFGITP